MRMHLHKAMAPAAALLVTLGCGGGSGGGDGGDEGGEAGAPSGSASQSIPTSMLSEGGTTLTPPAQEFSLNEIGFDFGSDDAPIAVVEFSDYGCGYCRRFHTGIFPTISEEYIETGKVRWKYVTYVSGMFANGMAAAYAAECAGEHDLFPPMSKLLYERQADWKSLGDPMPVFEELAREVGVDASDFQACVAEERHRPRLRSGILSGARLGVRGTPSFLVNGVPLVGAQPIEWWRDAFTAIAVEMEAAEAESGAANGDGS